MRCDICGRFVSYKDIQAGRAYRSMVTPDSAFSSEQWETLCPKCAKTGRKAKQGLMITQLVPRRN